MPRYVDVTWVLAPYCRAGLLGRRVCIAMTLCKRDYSGLRLRHTDGISKNKGPRSIVTQNQCVIGADLTTKTNNNYWNLHIVCVFGGRGTGKVKFIFWSLFWAGETQEEEQYPWHKIGLDGRMCVCVCVCVYVYTCHVHKRQEDRTFSMKHSRIVEGATHLRKTQDRKHIHEAS